MNDGKTEFIVFGSRKMLPKVPVELLKVGDEIITKGPCIRYLGANLDQSLTFHDFISTKCKKAMFNLKRIAAIRKFIDMNTCNQLMVSLVITHLDYANSILFGSTEKEISRLQNIQNFAAKIVCNKTKYDSATECLKRLHWLPVRFRIDYKMILITFNCIMTGRFHPLGMTDPSPAPDYLCDLLETQKITRPGLRKFSKFGCIYLQEKKIKRQTFAS